MQVQLNTRISVETAQALDEYCKTTGKSKASVVEAALVEYLRNQKEESTVQEKINEYIEGLKVDLQFNKVVRIDSFEDETGATEQDLFAALDAAGIEYTKPGGTYGDEHGQIKQVPDDCIYCDQFYIKD